jgi:hypothetical protein
MKADLELGSPGRAGPRSRRDRLVGAIVATAGPFLILAAVLFVLRRYAFTGRISTEDVVRYWLPMYDFLGTSLRHGHIPAWNPFALGGTPFAADPQSGWMQALPMLLFTAFPAGAAIRGLVVVQPMIAGIGLYAFLRSEGISRPAATVGGLALALVIAGSRLPLSIRFPGALAWTAVSLAACSRYLRSDRMSRRILWGVATALAWGQVAASHLTVGLLIGTGALLAFVLAKSFSNIRAGVWSGRRALGVGGLLVIGLPLVNMAYLLPRVAFAPETSLSLGYGRLKELSIQLTGVASPSFPGLVAGPKWPLDLATFPGRYVGASALLLAFGAFWSRRYRHLAVGFAVYGALGYTLGLRVVAMAIPSSIGSFPLVDQYLHEPYWLSFGVLLALGVLAGIGFEAWMEARPTAQRVWMIVPAIIVWLVLPIVFGAPAIDLLLLIVAGAVTVGMLAAALRRPALLAIVPILLLVEILVTALVGSSRAPFRSELRLLADLDRPRATAAVYLTHTPLSRVLAKNPDARYYTQALETGRPYVDPRALQNNESMIRGLENLGGYQAVQLQRYWLYVRRLQHQPMRYNYALFVHPPSSVSDLLDVGWVITRADDSPGDGFFPVADDGRWILHRRPQTPPRATVVSSWRIVATPEEALEAVADPAFDPSTTAIVEDDPGLPQSGNRPSGASATYFSLGNQAARVDLETPVPGILLIRNVWDRNWRATVDGRPAQVIPTDYLVQGVPVGAGRHRVLLTYDDPAIGYGLLASALVLAVLVAMAGLAARRERMPATEPVSASRSR